MGYTHGNKWDDESIKEAIKYVMEKGKIESMPTHTQMDSIIGNAGLSCAISKRGGSVYWANKLGLNIKPCESKFGACYEDRCIGELIDRGYDCEHTESKYPYDILVNDNVKIDVKVSNLYQSKNGSFYTFNLEKVKPTCDIFVCYCVEYDEVVKTFVIPSCVLSGKCQLSVGEIKSIYDKYIDAWWFVEEYDAFYQDIKQMSR